MERRSNGALECGITHYASRFTPSLHSPKEEVPARPCDRAGTKSGMGVRHALFPVADIGRPAFGGAAGFPTLFSTASGIFGLVAGPSSTLRCLDFE